MPSPLDNRPLKSGAASTFVRGAADSRHLDPIDPVAHWQRLLDAGLIGNKSRMSAAAIDNLIASEIALGLRRPTNRGER